MEFRIHYDYGGDTTDSLDVEGDTIEEIREIAKKETEQRGWDEANCWSEEIK